MTDTLNNIEEKHKSEVKRWWNSDKTYKWTGEVYDKDSPSYLHLFERREKTLKFFKNIEKGKKLNVFEFGFGGAKFAEDVLNLGHNYTGVDISNHLVQNAKNNNQKFIKNNQAKFYQGSLDEKQSVDSKSIDCVVICGAIHYSTNIQETFEEINRMLKDDGHLILTQGSMYCLNDLLNFRYLIKSLIWFISNEKFQYSYSLSFKDIIFETKLKKFFSRFEKNNFMNSKFMNNHSNQWKYKIRKRLLSYGRCKKLLIKNNFKILKTYSGPFLFYPPNKKYFIKNSFDKILKFLCIIKFPLINRLGDNQIFLTKKINI